MNELDPPPSIVELVKSNLKADSIWKLWLNNFYNVVKGTVWHEIGASGEPSFQNSWANVGGADDETLAYKLDGISNLKLKGLIDSGTITDGTVIFTLPDFVRPNKTIKVAGMFVQGSTENAYQLQINTNGDIAIYGVSGASPELSVNVCVDINN